MDRWWADPAASGRALRAVDGSDVVQGVGTAVLGYHGLSEAVLRPLASSTLVDGDRVAKALDGIDLTPVAKALSEATRPVVGPAADAYGQMLAAQIHADAVESTTRLMANLVASGMPWPTAVDRVAGVHGVPVQRLGKAGGALRAPAMARLVQADISDRALMDYAAHVGRREDTRDVVGKAERSQERWDERQVRRDNLGRFADKPDNSLSGLKGRLVTDADMERLKERQRERSRKRRANAREQQSQKVSLVELMRQAEASKPADRAVTQMQPQGSGKEQGASALDQAAEDRLNRALGERMDRAIEARVQSVMQALEERSKAREEGDFGPPPDDDLGYPVGPQRTGDDGKPLGWLASPRSGMVYMLVEQYTLESIAESKSQKVNIGALLDTTAVVGGEGGPGEPLSKEELRAVVLDASYKNPNLLDGLGILAFDGALVWDESLTEGGRHSSLTLDEDATYDVTSRNRKGKTLESDDTLDLKLNAYVTPGIANAGKQDIYLPHLTVALGSYEGYKTTGAVDKAWDERLVRRDDLGRFADKPDGSTVAQLAETDEQRALRERRIQRARERRKKAASQTKVSLVDLMRQAEQSSGRANTQAAERPAAALETQNDLDQALEAAIQRRMDSAIERRIQRLIEERRTKTEEREASRPLRREELLELDAQRWSADNAGTFQLVFGWDPYNGSPTDVEDHLDAEERAETFEAATSFGSPIRGAQAVVDGMIHKPPYIPIGLPEDPNTLGVPAKTLYDDFQAMEQAAAAADYLNRSRTDKTDLWLPMIEEVSESSLGVLYRPMVRQHRAKDTDTLVFGSKADWDAVRNGQLVTLEPLDSAFDEDPDDPGMGHFKELFLDIGSDEAYSDSLADQQRADFYVRAFRIKR